jgi:hypothetical protein
VARPVQRVPKLAKGINRGADPAFKRIRQFHLPVDSVWVMPEGTSTARVIANSPAAGGCGPGRGLNLTRRLDTLIFGAERGR